MMFHSYIPEGICFAAFVAFVARGYTMQFLTRIRKLRKTQQKNTMQQMQRSRFLQEYKSETSYTPEDGHIGRNM
jgi:hypothetical protein